MKRILTILFILSITATVLFSQESPFNGQWKLMRERGTNLDYFRSVIVEFSINKDQLSIHRSFGPRRPHEDQMVLKIGGKVNKVEITDPTIPTSLFMALRYEVGKTKGVTAEVKNGNVVIITEQYDVQSSQGSKPMKVKYSYELSDDKNIMTCRIQRDSRKGDAQVTLVFKKADYNNAYVYQMVDDWDIFSKLPEQACLISIQGIVNEHGPNLYFTFGPQFPFNYTEEAVHISGEAEIFHLHKTQFSGTVHKRFQRHDQRIHCLGQEGTNVADRGLHAGRTGEGNCHHGGSDTPGKEIRLEGD